MPIEYHMVLTISPRLHNVIQLDLVDFRSAYVLGFKDWLYVLKGTMGTQNLYDKHHVLGTENLYKSPRFGQKININSFQTLKKETHGT
jgi:hypothetical protein